MEALRCVLLWDEEEDEDEEAAAVAECLFVPLVMGLGLTLGNVMLPLTRDSAPSCKHNFKRLFTSKEIVLKKV